MGNAKLIYHLKHEFHNRYIKEQTIYFVDDQNYPDGLKYSLVVIDLETGKKLVMDNHKPKGPHYHLDHLEFKYDFSGVDKLLADFDSLIFRHFGEKL